MENTEKVVYVDNAATTACAPEVLEVMVQALSGACGNPSSHYSIGYEAKEFVDKLKEGTEYEIAQLGRNVSGGQKQRLSIARALARKPEILKSFFTDLRTDGFVL